MPLPPRASAAAASGPLARSRRLAPRSRTGAGWSAPCRDRTGPAWAVALWPPGTGVSPRAPPPRARLPTRGPGS